MPRRPQLHPYSVIAVGITTAGTLLSGCTHIHNAADAKVADSAVTQTQALADAQNKVFDTIDANNQAASDTMINFLNKDAAASGYGPLRFKETTWAAFGIEMGIQGQANSPVLEPFARQVEALAGDISELPQAQLEKKSIDQAVKAADVALTDAKKRQVDWDKQAAFWSKLIETLPTADEEIASHEDLKATLTKLRNTADQTSFTYVDGSGKEQTMTLGSEAAARLKALAIEQSATPLLTAPPGLTLPMAALAKDLAEAEAQRATALLHKLEAEKLLLDEAVRYQTLATEQVTVILQALKLAQPPSSETCIATIVEESAKPLPSRAATLYEVLLRAGFVDYLAKQVFILNVRSLLLQKQYNDTATRINVSERQVLVNRGIESLQLYHDGGIKPEQIAQLAYAVAQTGVLSVIAVK